MEKHRSRRRSCISSMIDKALRAGKKYRENAVALERKPPGRTPSEIEAFYDNMRKSRAGAEDSGFEESSNDLCLQNINKPEHVDFDQLIFNVHQQEKINTQELLVNVTTALSVRDCPQRADEIAEYSRVVKPVLSKAPMQRKRTREYPEEHAVQKELEYYKLLQDAIAEVKRYPKQFEDELIEDILDTQIEDNALLKKKRAEEDNRYLSQGM